MSLFSNIWNKIFSKEEDVETWTEEQVEAKETPYVKKQPFRFPLISDDEKLEMLNDNTKESHPPTFHKPIHVEETSRMQYTKPSKVAEIREEVSSKRGNQRFQPTQVPSPVYGYLKPKSPKPIEKLLAEKQEKEEEQDMKVQQELRKEAFVQPKTTELRREKPQEKVTQMENATSLSEESVPPVETIVQKETVIPVESKLPTKLPITEQSVAPAEPVIHETTLPPVQPECQKPEEVGDAPETEQPSEAGREVQDDPPKLEEKKERTGSKLPFNVLMLKSDKEKIASTKNLHAVERESFSLPKQSMSVSQSISNEPILKPNLGKSGVDKFISSNSNIGGPSGTNEPGSNLNVVNSDSTNDQGPNPDIVNSNATNNQGPNSNIVNSNATNENKTNPNVAKTFVTNQHVVTPIVTNQNNTTQVEANSIVTSKANPKTAYDFPVMEFLIPPEEKTEDREWMEAQGARLIEALSYFQVKGNIERIVQGPAVTQFEMTVGQGTKVSKIRNLADDLKLALAAKDIRIQAPIPGKSSIGIEIPNRSSRPVRLSEVVQHERFLNSTSPLEAALGLDLTGHPVSLDLRKMPHGLIAGATGSGKSVCINSILVSLLFKASPQELKLLLIDPKMVELAPFNHIPHLVSPVITDVKAATASLKWAVEEMERRYQLFAHVGARDITRYNALAEEKREFSLKLPYILIVIDELADLMMMSPADVEESICRIAQKARACGIHLVLATQRPSVDVITGLIKSNIPTRIAFSVSSQIDSRTILDTQGAERLLGRGDMLYQGNGMSAPVRIQGTFVTDEEIERVTEYARSLGEPEYLFEQEELLKKVEANEEQDDLFEEACRFVVEQGSASTSLLQRKYHIGYNRAARLIDMMERQGFISEQKGSKARDVFLSESDVNEYFSSTY